MADITVTAANVALNSGPSTIGIAGEAFTAGMAVYRKASDGKWYKAQRDGSSEESGGGSRANLGIAIGSPAVGQKVEIALDGADVSIGATVAVGVAYFISATAGGINSADAASTGNYNSLIGIGKSTSRIRVACVAAEATSA